MSFDLLKETVSYAMSAVAQNFRSQYKTLRAAGITAKVALLSRAERQFPENFGGQVWNSNGVNTDTRIAAQVADFPNLEAGMPVVFDGAVALILSIRKAGEAAWFIGLSNPLDEAEVRVDGARESGQRFATSTVAAVTYTGYDDAEGNTTANERRTADVYIAKPGVMMTGWTETFPPRIGDVVTMRDDARYAVRSVQDFPNSWLLKVRRTA